MNLKGIELIAIVAAAACKGYSATKEYNTRRWWVRELEELKKTCLKTRSYKKVESRYTQTSANALKRSFIVGRFI